MTEPFISFIDKDKNQFFATLRQRVNMHFKENKISKHYNRKMLVKTIILLSLYILPFTGMLIWKPSSYINYILWVLMGFSLAGIGMSVMHDANHGAYAANRRINNLLGYSLNLLGGAVFNWKLQHNILHHTYTNILDMDDDIEDKLVVRLSPHTIVKWYHRFQVVYAFLLYGILTLYWVFAKDFVQFVKYTQKGINKNSRRQNWVTLFRIVLSKLLYFTVFLIIPVFVLDMSPGPLLIGFLLMHYIAGVILTTIFQLAHTVEGTDHPLPNNEGYIENAWAIHQMNTTVNFSMHNKYLSWYLGGLNFQVEHHLFPSICHIHYPDIAPIVKQTAQEYGIPYLENPSFLQALGSHIRTLRRFGRNDLLSCESTRQSKY